MVDIVVVWRLLLVLACTVPSLENKHINKQNIDDVCILFNIDDIHCGLINITKDAASKKPAKQKEKEKVKEGEGKEGEEVKEKRNESSRSVHH